MNVFRREVMVLRGNLFKGNIMFSEERFHKQVGVSERHHVKKKNEDF